MTRNDLKVTGLYDLQAEVATRMAARRRIGPFDHSFGSFDQRVAMTRAVRIWHRVVMNTRLTLRQCEGF